MQTPGVWAWTGRGDWPATSLVLETAAEVEVLCHEAVGRPLRAVGHFGLIAAKPRYAASGPTRG